jgi:hypothetical protein
MSSLSVVLHWFHCGIRSLPSLLAPHDPSSLFMWLENTSAVAIFVARCLLFMGVDAQSSSLLCACLPIFGLHSGVSPPDLVCVSNMGKQSPPVWRPRALTKSCSCAVVLVARLCSKLLHYVVYLGTTSPNITDRQSPKTSDLITVRGGARDDSSDYNKQTYN